MAYDENLASRIEDHIGNHPGLTSHKMFGGVGYMLQGNMAVGIRNDSLIVRVDPAEHDSSLAEPGTSEFGMPGRQPMRGWIEVDAEAIGSDATLGEWIDRGMKFAGTLPPK
jgi:TfoX/Sxy family transcriptional regulator of competence genes